MKVDQINQICTLTAVHNHLPIEVGSDHLDVTDRVQIQETKRGGICYNLDGHTFIKCAEKGITMRYRCSLYNKRQCRCRLLVYDEKVSMSNVHNHD